MHDNVGANADMIIVFTALNVDVVTWSSINPEKSSFLNFSMFPQYLRHKHYVPIVIVHNLANISRTQLKGKNAHKSTTKRVMEARSAATCAAEVQFLAVLRGEMHRVRGRQLREQQEPAPSRRQKKDEYFNLQKIMN